ncbi:glycosyltransferase family 39 protein [Cyanobium sp. Maggiore-St4-Cus]|nr:glycosyltransferase family 39 protein [Cyanobium sp. Maggiore-St4-Cus]
MVCGLAFFHGLFSLAPLDKTEALQIGVAETMLRLGEWVVPEWNGHLYADKPPLPYWLAELVWRRFGLIPLLARIPAALAATAGVAGLAWLTQRCCRQTLQPRETWARTALAGTLLAVSPGWIGFGRTAVHDIYLALAVLLALGCYALGFAGASLRNRPLLGALGIGLSCGFGFLAKGLLGIGLPLLIIAVDATIHRTSRRLLLRPSSLALFSGGLLAIVTPWAAALVSGRHWAFLQGFLGFSHLQRATRAVDGHAQPLLFYLPVLLGLIWPWWPLLLSALGQLWQRRRHWRQAAGGNERLQQLAAVWLLLGLALFSAIPTKLPGYVLPLLPAAVLLIATAPRHPTWCLRLVSLQLGLLSAALLAGLISLRLGLLGSYGQALQAAPGGTTVWLAGGSGLALLAALYGGWSPQENQAKGRRWLALLSSMLLVVSCLPALAMPYRQLEQEPVLELARAAHRRHGKADVLFVLGRPRYSVVADAELDTIFGSPLRTPSGKPISSLANWKLHGADPEALVLGSCLSVQALGDEPSLRITLLEQRRSYCLARLHRTSAQP